MATAVEPIESFEQSDMSEVMHSGLFFLLINQTTLYGIDPVKE